MKPYSKKYLTLALAGILATSIPMTAFAETAGAERSSETRATELTEEKEKKDNKQDNKQDNKNGNQEEKTQEELAKEKEEAAKKAKEKADQEAAEKAEKEKKEKEEADKKAKEEARKEEENHPSSVTVKVAYGDRVYRSDIERELPRGAKIISVEYYKNGNDIKSVKVEYADGKVKDVRVITDESRRYNTYGDIDLKNVKYDGKKITGRTASFARIYVEKDRYNDEYLGSADRDGYFSINYTIKKNESIKIYAKDGNKTSSSVKISGTTENLGKEVEANSLSISGKNLTGYVKNSPNTNIRVYFDGKLVGSFKTDDKSYFSTTLTEYINPFDVKNLKFYKEDKASDVFLKVTEAIEGTKVVKGKADYKDTVRVLDSNNNELGRFTVPVSGIFSVDLVRDLIGGEKITVEAKNADGSIKKQEYTVTKKPQVETQVAYIKGYPDGTFKPQNNVTRAEAAKMFGVLLNGSENFGTSTTTRFTDANGEWYSQAVNYVVSKGLINGYPNGEFKPNDSITRAEFAQMISGYIKASEAKANFTDIENHWAREAIDKLYGNKHINGYPDGTFKPNEKITRAEAVTILNSVFNRVTTADSIKNIDKNALRTFSDVNPDFWAYYNILDASNSVKTSK